MRNYGLSAEEMSTYIHEIKKMMKEYGVEKQVTLFGVVSEKKNIISCHALMCFFMRQ